jgi:hypothetical protein
VPTRGGWHRVWIGRGLGTSANEKPDNNKTTRPQGPRRRVPQVC